ncbi:MAG: ketoacyl-ACP synthase III [Myxococcota bacterium]|nr:ketoacyl-ACP synthase III [Myxococcota bacterium]
MTLWLHALGHAHPEAEVTNRFLEELDIGTDDAWIMERVGIRSRRTALSLDYIRETHNRDVRAAAEGSTCTTAQLGARAAEMAIERSGVEREQIGMLLFGSSAADYDSPADACNVACELDLELPALDVNSACTSLLAQVHLLSLMDPAKLPPYVLVVACDTLTKTVCYDDRAAAVLWGDGAAAALFSTREPGRAHVLGSTMASRPSGADKVVVERGGHFRQEGRAVQAFAIRQTGQCFEALREEYADPERPFHFIGHQANLRMLENVCRRCEIPADRHHANVEWYGNTGAAGSASVMSMQWEKWTEHDDVAVVGVGAGLSWSSYLLRFGAEAAE